MCTYCYCGDQIFKHDPPWRPSPITPWHPNIPAPLTPIVSPPWEIDRLREFKELLDRIKKLEDRLGCECVEPNKPDYIKLFSQRIEQLETRAKEKEKEEKRVSQLEEKSR